jgi:hypothetical protein
MQVNPTQLITVYQEMKFWGPILGGAAFLWKAGVYFADIKGRALTAESHLNKFATNCFPTMQASLQSIEKSNAQISESLKTLVEKSKPTKKKK